MSRTIQDNAVAVQLDCIRPVASRQPAEFRLGCRKLDRVNRQRISDVVTRGQTAHLQDDQRTVLMGDAAVVRT